MCLFSAISLDLQPQLREHLQIIIMVTRVWPKREKNLKNKKNYIMVTWMWPKKDNKFEREQIETWNHHKHLDKDSFKQGVGKLLV